MLRNRERLIFVYIETGSYRRKIINGKGRRKKWSRNEERHRQIGIIEANDT
jgi:hypothetical protein